MKGEIINHNKQKERIRKIETCLNPGLVLKSFDFYELENNVIHYRDEKFIFKNDSLYYALKKLNKDKQNIILFFYFLEMTDQEIAETLKIIRRTVNYKRHRALVELKKYMED